MRKRLAPMITLAVALLLAAPSAAGASDGCPPGWDAKTGTEGFRADRNGNGVVCTSRLANQFGPGMPVFIDDGAPGSGNGHEPPPSFYDDPPPRP